MGGQVGTSTDRHWKPPSTDRRQKSDRRWTDRVPTEKVVVARLQGIQIALRLAWRFTRLFPLEWRIFLWSILEDLVACALGASQYVTQCVVRQPSPTTSPPWTIKIKSMAHYHTTIIPLLPTITIADELRWSWSVGQTSTYLRILLNESSNIAVFTFIIIIALACIGIDIECTSGLTSRRRPYAIIVH